MKLVNYSSPRGLTFKKALSRALAAKREHASAESPEHAELALKALQERVAMAVTIASSEFDKARAQSLLETDSE
jgi:hypothetical protein